MAYRYWCGECGFKTSWGTESQGERQQIEHYAKHHQGIAPGGRVESNRRSPSGGTGCLVFIAVTVLLLLFATLHHG